MRGPLTKDEIPKEVTDKYKTLLDNYTHDEQQEQFLVKVYRANHDLAKQKIEEFLASHPELKIYSYNIEFLDDEPEVKDDVQEDVSNEVPEEVKDQLEAMRDNNE